MLLSMTVFCVSEFPLKKEGVKLGLALLPEDDILRGFPPLVQVQEKLTQVNLSRLEQVCIHLQLN